MFSPVDISKEQALVESTIKADSSLALFKQVGLFGQSYYFTLVEYAQNQSPSTQESLHSDQSSHSLSLAQTERQTFLSQYISESQFHAYLDPYLHEFLDLQTLINEGEYTEERLKPIVVDGLRIGMNLAIPILICPAHIYSLFTFSTTANGEGKDLVKQYWEIYTLLLEEGNFPFARWMSEGVIEKE